MTQNKITGSIPPELTKLRDSLRPREAPSRVEQVLLKEFRARQKTRTPANEWWRTWAGVSAVAMIALAVLVLLPDPRAPAPVQSAAQEMTTDYMPIGYGQPVYPEEFTQVVRVSFPRSEMVQFGLPVQPSSASDQVMADVVLGEDGVARAIRFVQ